MRNTTFTISTRNKEDIDRILLDKYHNYLTKVEDNTEVEYIESNDEYNHLQNLFVVTCKDYEVNILNKFYIDVDSEEWNSFLNFCLTRYKATRVAIHGMLDILPPHFCQTLNIQRMLTTLLYFQHPLRSTSTNWVNKLKSMPSII